MAELELPDEMKAAVYDKHGKVEEVLKVKNVRTPKEVRGNDVLVKVYAAGMNPVNYKLVEGRLAMASPSLPCIDGLDVAGVVVKVGPKVQSLQPGDAVWGKAGSLILPSLGTFAEYTVLSETCLHKKPDEISFVEAASLGVVALTGYAALILTGNMQEGSKILILGGSGGTGSFGIQLAKNILKAGHVAATCSERNIDYVKELGADEVINYREQNWADVLAGQNYDFIYDCVGSPTHWNDAQRVLKPNGHFLTITGDHDDTPVLTIGELIGTGWRLAGRKLGSLFGGRKYDYVMPSTNRDQYGNITKWVAERKIVQRIDKTFPLDDILEAYKYQHTNRAVGKIVVTVVDQPE